MTCSCVHLHAKQGESHRHFHYCSKTDLSNCGDELETQELETVEKQLAWYACGMFHKKIDHRNDQPTPSATMVLGKQCQTTETQDTQILN